MDIIDSTLVLGGTDEIYKIIDHQLCPDSRRVTVEALCFASEFCLGEKRTIDARNGPCDVICVEIRPATEAELVRFLPHDHVATFRSA